MHNISHQAHHTIHVEHSKSTSYSAKKGILIRNRLALERAKDVNAMVFDKTGTLTEGKFGVSKIISSINNKEFLKIVASIEIRIKDVAKVVEVPAYRMGVADFNRMGDIVGDIVIMRFGADAYKVIKNIKEKIEEIKKGLPEDVKIVPVYDRSTLIKRAIDNLKSKLIEESIVVLTIVGLFLFHLPSAIVIIIFLILSILATFIAMNHLGITSNIMSLGGIAIAIGTMVDAAIVLVEDIHRRLEEGKGLRDAIILSSKDVGKPIFFALLIVTVSFVLLFVLEGQACRLFNPLVATKTPSMFLVRCGRYSKERKPCKYKVGEWFACKLRVYNSRP